MARKLLTVHRKGFVFVRGGKRVRVPPTTFKIKDVGAPGRGPKIIKIKREGALTKLANEMGYDRVSDVPNDELPTLAKKMIEKYGERSALGMTRAQVIFRKRKEDSGKKKFELLDKIVRTQVKKTPGWQ